MEIVLLLGPKSLYTEENNLRLQPNCSDLQSSATLPDFIAQFRLGFGETMVARQPAFSRS
jgi:hypothetical protein